ncbi:MAG: ACP S-malonyltransferase [Elusimicrobia bacterium]|nr:ACP S-malonyltransferase [Elusimicrobiota bacterium]
MAKLAAVFPGQASQYVGMGKEFYDKYSFVKDIFGKANEILGYDIKKIIFEGPLDLLTQTKYTQPAVFITSIACFKVFTSLFSLRQPADSSLISFAAGHSLGEYSALVSAEVLTLEDGLKLVNKRAELLQESCEKTKGSMLAVLNAEKNVVDEICSESGKSGVCEAVNFNAPGQIIISGETAALKKAAELAKSKKIKTIPLTVSGAFHSSLMKDAAVKMAEELKKYTFKNPKFPVITNCDAEITTDSSVFAEKLTKQIASPVLWIDSINKIISQNCNTFIEFGPKTVVSGMIKKISKTAETFNVENETTLNNIKIPEA